MDHVQRGASFGMAISLGQVTLHDQAWAVLHQRMADETEHCPGAGRLPVKTGTERDQVDGDKCSNVSSELANCMKALERGNREPQRGAAKVKSLDRTFNL